MDVVSEVLDREVVDRNGRQMGRVDGIVLDIAAGEPPRVAALVVGPSALAYRLHPRLGRLMKAIEIRLGLDSRRPTRIEFEDVEHIHRKIRCRLSISDTAVEAIEQWLRGWVSRLPGSR